MVLGRQIRGMPAAGAHTAPFAQRHVCQTHLHLHIPHRADAGSAPQGRAALSKNASKRLVLYTSHVWKNPFEDACDGCAGQRKASPDVKAAMRQRAMALRNDTTDDMYVDMLGRWECAASSKLPNPH